MSTSGLTYKDYSFADHGEVYRVLEEVFLENDITYYLVGANARDVQLYKAGIKPTRGTADIDFAIMVPDVQVYASIFEELCKRGFRKTKENHRLIYDRTGTVLDLMPYGEIEQDHTVNFDARDISLSVLGFKEVGKHIEIVRIPEAGFSLPTSSVVGLILLKLVSWNDKKERIKDLEDISLLLKYGWDFYEEDAYQKHLDLFEVEDFDRTMAAARIIGRKMRPILSSNDYLFRTIMGILETAIKEKPRAATTETVLAIHMDKSIGEIQKILSEVKQGIME